MKTRLLSVCLLVFIIPGFSQQAAFNQNSSRSNYTTRAYNQNNARSNHAKIYAPKSDIWSFGIVTAASKGINSDENTLFRGNSIATKMFGNYYFGNVGLGMSGGFISGKSDEGTINNFITDRGYQQANTTGTDPFNGYLLFGPAFQYGERIKVLAELQGGMFLNNPGSLTIGPPQASGAVRPYYRYEQGDKTLFPGFSGSISLAYPINASTNFFINTEYLQTRSSIIIYDPKNGIDIPAPQTRDVKLINFGIGISKSFGRRDQASGMATGKSNAQFNPKEYTVTKTYQPGKPVYGNITMDHDDNSYAKAYQPGQPVYGNRAASESCGPVTRTVTHPDGTKEEMTFSCPEDAANYIVNSHGTPGTDVSARTFAAPHVLEQKGIIHRDLAARNILFGRVSWGSSPTGSGIVTNVSSVTNLGGGASTAAYARSGVATGAGAAAGAALRSQGVITDIYAREAGSGKTTGKSQYEALFLENNANEFKYKGAMGSVQSNPLYVDKGLSGTNPMYNSDKQTIENGEANENLLPELSVYLLDAETGATVASTKTEIDGTFFFANVPSGNYVVNVSGSFFAKKGYDYYMSKRADIGGKILAPDDYWSVNLATDTGSVEYAQAVIKTKTKSNQSNDRVSAASNLIWSPKSNKTITQSIGDIDQDGEPEIIVGKVSREILKTYFETGDIPNQEDRLVGGALPGGGIISSALRPGAPIKGLSVKGGRNPGGNLNQRLAQTNESGVFEIPGLEAGNYSVSVNLSYYINDETLVSIGDADPNIVTSESNLKGDVKITASQNSQSLKSGINSINNNMPNRISMNVTVPKQTQGATFGEKSMGKSDNNNETRAQNNNTVRSNRTDNAIIIADLDGDGEMESSYLNINGEIATISITEPGVHVTEGGNVAGGINITDPNTQTTESIKQVMQQQVRTSPKAWPSKWISPDIMSKKVWGDPHVDEKDGSLKLGIANSGSVNKGKWNSTEVAIKALRCSDGVCLALTGNGDDYPVSSKISLNGLPPGQPVIKAAFWFVDDSGKTYKRETDANGNLSLNGLPPGVPLRVLANMGVSGNDDILILFSTDALGNTISNVLKTKHDTVKNSISNIR